MPEIKYGIEKLQPALILAIQSGEATFNTFKDGFQPFPDLVAMLKVGTDLQAVFKDRVDIINQASDVDTEEGSKLNKAIVDKFGWTSEKAARKIKAGFNLIWAIIFFVDELNEPGDFGGQATGSSPVK